MTLILRAKFCPMYPMLGWTNDKTKVGYEIPINRHFYVYKPPRPLDQIEADITELEGEIAGLLEGLVA